MGWEGMKGKEAGWKLTKISRLMMIEPSPVKMKTEKKGHEDSRNPMMV